MEDHTAGAGRRKTGILHMLWKRSQEGKKMAEIWMICKPDLEYRIGAYAYETDMDKAYVHKLADKVAEKNKCKTIVKVL